MVAAQAKKGGQRLLQKGNAMNYSTDFPSIKDQVSPEEWRARVDLAACYRLIDTYGMTDLIYNHITARVPGEEDVVLLNLYGLLYKEITASSLVKIHVDGEIIWKPDSDYGINKSGYVIHGAIHKARPDVACVLHTHTRAGMASLVTLAITTTRGRPSNSTNGSGWCAISARMRP
jgi:hypothetical protein